MTDSNAAKSLLNEKTILGHPRGLFILKIKQEA